jgi:hypothetical protein
MVSSPATALTNSLFITLKRNIGTIVPLLAKFSFRKCSVPNLSHDFMFK